MKTGTTKREADRGKEQRPRKVNAVAPIPICDIGGWTDTWFAKHGSIFNIAVYPYVEVQVGEHVCAGKGSISIKLENYNESYTLDPGSITYGSHPLIDAAIDIVGLPPDTSLDVNVFPPHPREPRPARPPRSRSPLSRPSAPSRGSISPRTRSPRPRVHRIAPQLQRHP